MAVGDSPEQAVTRRRITETLGIPPESTNAEIYEAGLVYAAIHGMTPPPAPDDAGRPAPGICTSYAAAFAFVRTLRDPERHGLDPRYLPGRTHPWPS